MSRLTVVRSDITRLAVDAIVNAANERMLGGGGVDGAIHKAAGPELLRACEQVAQVTPGVRCPTGAARLTPAFGLPARFIIHTVGPVWSGGAAREAELLASCYRECLVLGAGHGLGTLAFPAISCGVFGYPPTLAAAIAVREIRAHLANDGRVERVMLVARDAQMLSVLERALR